MNFSFPWGDRFGMVAAMRPTRLILVRHGETTWNVEGRYQGHADSLLTELGTGQARALADRFARETMAALYSSDLGRARQTADIVAAATRHEVRLDARLRERCLGVFQGLTRAEARERWPQEFERFRAAGWDDAPPDGESARQSVDRFVGGMTELAARHPGETIAVVTHGGVLGGFLRHVLGVPPERPRRYKRFNASWNVFTREADRWYLSTWGDISHLAPSQTLDDL